MVVVYLFYEFERLQRGSGSGSVLKSFARFAILLVKQVALVDRKRALQTATDVGQDVLAGISVKQTVQGHGVEVIRDLVQQGAKNIKSQSRGICKCKAPIKAYAPSKPASCSQSKKPQTSNPIDRTLHLFLKHKSRAKSSKLFGTEQRILGR